MSYLVIGVEGPELSGQEREWSARPEVGGVILFDRNCKSPAQVQALCSSIREVDAAALICIDQEGGPVQRIRAPLTDLPPLRTLGRRYDRDEDDALELAFLHGRLMASEVLALGVDLSLAPVLDLDGPSAAVGERALHGDPEVVKELGRAYIKGMHEAGMAACGKHFPGHGTVIPDTHVSAAEDCRSFSDIAISDLRPFTVAIQHGLEAVMMAHVVYPEVERCAAGYSRRWIGEILRDRIGFEGAVISDDLGMAAAGDAGDLSGRLHAALAAGCDLLLVCRVEDVRELFATAKEFPRPGADRRGPLRARRRVVWADLASDPERALWRERLAGLTEAT